MRKGFTIYPSMTDSRIIELVQTALNAVRASNKKEKAKDKIAISKKISGNSDLDDAINAQRNFINGNI